MAVFDRFLPRSTAAGGMAAALIMCAKAIVIRGASDILFCWWANPQVRPPPRG